MTELKIVLDYIEGLPVKLEAGLLNNQDRITCYVMHNRLVEAIDIANPRYKTMTDLLKESIISVKEMRDDIERMVGRRYTTLPLMDNILFSDAIVELSKATLDTYEDCTNYLTDLAISCYVSIQSNPSITEEVRLMLNTLIYISIVALNLFNKTKGLPPERKGIEISFGRKRKQELGA